MCPYNFAREDGERWPSSLLLCGALQMEHCAGVSPTCRVPGPAFSGPSTTSSGGHPMQGANSHLPLTGIQSGF